MGEMSTVDLISLADNISATMVFLLIGAIVFRAAQRIAPWLAEREEKQQARLDTLLREQRENHKLQIRDLLEQSDRHVEKLLQDSRQDRELFKASVRTIDNRLSKIEREIGIVADRVAPGLGRESDR
jgi:flagellar motility protein MotE (MotC chaperone)